MKAASTPSLKVGHRYSHPYDPVLDPSPIGVEERGATRQVRISRIAPRRYRRAQASGHRSSSRTTEWRAGKIDITILNGHRRAGNTQDKPEVTLGHSGSEYDHPDEQVVDVYVHGSSTRLEHAALLPYEVYCRTLRRRAQRLPSLTGLKIIARNRAQDDRPRASLGITILLCGAGDWVSCESSEPCTDDEHLSSETASTSTFLDPGKDLPYPVEAAAKADGVTRLLFSDQNGRSSLAEDAFRVQFGPGPLGMELEENPSKRGVVQIRRVLEGGQAQQDGRLAVGSLILAVNDWTHPITFKDAEGTSEEYTGERIPDGHPHEPCAVRSLTAVEEALAHRDPDGVFVVWALNRSAPAAVAALGPPKLERPPLPPGARSSTSLFTGFDVTKDAVRRDKQKSRVDGSTWAPGSSFTKAGTRASLGNDERCVGRNAREAAFRCTHGNELRFDAALGRSIGPESDEGSRLSYFGGRYAQGESPPPSSPTSGTSLPCDSLYSPATTPTTSHPPEGSPPELFSRLSPEELRIPASPGYSCKVTEGCTMVEKKWEFETAGGLLNNHDDELLARRRPACERNMIGSAGSQSEEEVEETPLLPFGLQASKSDDFPVYISFCNSHASGLMRVSSPEGHPFVIPGPKDLRNIGFRESLIRTLPYISPAFRGKKICHQRLMQRAIRQAVVAHILRFLLRTALRRHFVLTECWWNFFPATHNTDELTQLGLWIKFPGLPSLSPERIAEISGQ